jgi:cell division protein FtsL
MSTIGDILKSVREVLLLQSNVELLAKEVDEQNKEMRGMSDKIVDLDKRVFAIERIMDLGARQSGQRRIEE